MKVLGIKHIISVDNSFEDYFEKIKRIMMESKELVNPIDLIVGPDFALKYCRNGKLDFSNNDKIFSSFIELSRAYPDSVIIPGTCPIQEEGNLMVLCAPIFRCGDCKRFYKETDAGEGKMAEEVGLSYKRGDSSKNKLEINKKTISVGICSDHGKQRIPEDTFLEVILAYDYFGGFYPGRKIHGNYLVDRYGMVVNGINGEVSMQKYKYGSEIEIIEPICASKEFLAFDIN
ncbi:MAG: hypothetical protein QW727_01475 [Candidatus Pacearchaeota archaeon]